MNVKVNPDDIERWSKELKSLAERFAVIFEEYSNNYRNVYNIYESAYAKLEGERANLNASINDYSMKIEQLRVQKERLEKCDPEDEKYLSAQMQIDELEEYIGILNVSIAQQREKLAKVNEKSGELEWHGQRLATAFECGETLKKETERTESFVTMANSLSALAEKYRDAK